MLVRRLEIASTEMRWKETYCFLESVKLEEGPEKTPVCNLATTGKEDLLSGGITK